MAILTAAEISWSPVPRCPACDRGVMPLGKAMPFAVDASGKVYCSDHGGTIEAGYPERLSAYREWRQRRADAISALEADARELAQAQRMTGSDGEE